VCAELARVPFAYYSRLSARQQAVYRQSDAVTALRVPAPEALWPLVGELAAALARDDRPGVTAACGRLVAGIASALAVPPAEVQVLAVRPTLRWGELHGLYTSEGAPRIQVWMRTARHRRVVAFRTFLRTLLHELCHHLDYVHLKLADSYHTEGFFKRESSLFHQLVPRDPGGA
jgi:hypothetical protein